MKMTYLAKRNAILSRENISWGSGALAFAIIILLLRLIVPSAFAATVAPAFKLSNSVTAIGHEFFSVFGDTAKLSIKNEELVRQNSALSEENQALSTKLSDLAGLRGSLSSANNIVAGIVARPPVSPYDTFLVSGGFDIGVTLGQEAFGPGGVPLGTVTEVSDTSARVTLFTAPGVTTSGWVGKTKVPLTLLGRGGGAFEAAASRSSAIAEGDTVYLPGPGALPAGTVLRIDSDQSSPSETLRIQSAINLFSITWIELRDTGI